MKTRVIISLAVLPLAMLACSLGNTGGNQPANATEVQSAYDQLPAGDASSGQQVFLAQPCHTCHMDQSVGPQFPGDPALATRAETRRSDYSPELYLYESIVQPNAYVVPGFQKDIMPGDFGRTLSQQEIADLVAYLMTMK